MRTKYRKVNFTLNQSKWRSRAHRRELLNHILLHKRVKKKLFKYVCVYNFTSSTPYI